MDALFYKGLAAELDRTLRGLQIRGVEDPVLEGRTPEGLLLRFLGQSGGLMVSLDRDCPGAFWTRSVAGRRTVRGLHQRLLPRLQDAVVLGVRQPAPDRVLAVDLEAPEGRRTLWLEMTGRLGNLVLSDQAGLILVVARAVFPRMSRVRQLEVGGQYVPPPLPKGWAADLGEHAQDAGAVSFNDQAEAAYQARERALAVGRKRGELGSRLRGRVEKRQRLLRRLEAEHAEAGEGARYRDEGEHLAAHLHELRRGQQELVCPRFDGEGEIRIALDPTRSPAENLERLFKRARKAERARDQVATRGEEIRVELRQFGLWLERIESAGWEALVQVESELPAQAADDTALETEKLPAGVQAFRSSAGLIVLVGRTAQGNHAVTFELAKPRDLWFHARDYPGSHVVLRRHGKKEPPPSAVLEAAALAAHFSKAAGQGVVDVACCPRHRVRAQKDAGAGKVNYSGEKTLTVRMHAELVEPLLKRRLNADAP